MSWYGATLLKMNNIETTTTGVLCNCFSQVCSVNNIVLMTGIRLDFPCKLEVGCFMLCVVVNGDRYTVIREDYLISHAGCTQV